MRTLPRRNESCSAAGKRHDVMLPLRRSDGVTETCDSRQHSNVLQTMAGYPAAPRINAHVSSPLPHNPLSGAAPRFVSWMCNRSKVRFRVRIDK
jgi:hypothetical protein